MCKYGLYAKIHLMLAIPMYSLFWILIYFMEIPLTGAIAFSAVLGSLICFCPIFFFKRIRLPIHYNLKRILAVTMVLPVIVAAGRLISMDLPSYVAIFMLTILSFGYFSYLLLLDITNDKNECST